MKRRVNIKSKKVKKQSGKASKDVNVKNVKKPVRSL